MMALTNPQRSAYKTYAARQASLYLQKNACSQAPQTFGDFLQNQCVNLAEFSQPYLKPVVNLSTRQHNYVFFSIYETQVSLHQNLPAYNAKTIGFLNLFWTYENGVELRE